MAAWTSSHTTPIMDVQPYRKENLMPDQFKPGDVVMLKSGGPKMTVNAVGEQFGGAIRVWCDWFDGTKKLSGNFEPNSLKHAVIS